MSGEANHGGGGDDEMSSCCQQQTPQYSTASMDLTRFQDTTHAHDFTQGLSRVVMVRKMEQRIFINSPKNGQQQPQVETLTKETVQTFRPGNRTERKVTTSQKKNSQQISDSQEFITLSRSASSSPELMSSLKQINDKKSISRIRSPRKSEIEASQFIEQCFQAHNEYRMKHKVPPLVLSKKSLSMRITWEDFRSPLLDMGVASLSSPSVSKTIPKATPHVYLCRYSEEWAKHLAQRGGLEHRQNCPYGENLFCCWTSLPSYNVNGQEPVDCWYQEKDIHPFGKEPSSLKSGHFSQVVWMASRELGVGIARSRNGQIFVVANYDPPGNFLGQFRENVPPVGGFTDAEHSPNSLSITPYTDEQLYDDMMRLHNEYRKKHKVPKLTLNKELCRRAQDWAKILARDDKLIHRPESTYGENLFSMWSSNLITGKDACILWYQEGKDYNYSVEPKVLKCGHFTQMLWKNTRQVGFGMAKGRSGKVVIVANYLPAGNIIGQFTENVIPPS